MPHSKSSDALSIPIDQLKLFIALLLLLYQLQHIHVLLEQSEFYSVSMESATIQDLTKILKQLLSQLRSDSHGPVASLS